MRVVVVAGFAPSLIRFRGPLLAELVRRGHEVVALAGEASDAVTAGLADLGVRFEPLALRRTALDPRADLALIADLTARLRRLAPDVFFAYTVKAVVHGGFAARLARVPRRIGMLTGLGYGLMTVEGRRRAALRAAIGALLRVSAAGYHGLIFQNPDDEADLAAAGFLPASVPRHQVAGSGIDLDEFPAVPAPEGEPIFLMIARLLRDKGVVEFVEAARQARSRAPHARFRLVGGRDDNPASVGAEQVAAWRAEGLVELTGELADVRPELAACAALVLPSYREGTPRSVLEAMATGRAVITTDVPGCRQTVEPGESGLLVPPRDAASLADAIVALASDPTRRAAMGARGRARAAERYDVRIVNRTMLEVLGL